MLVSELKEVSGLPEEFLMELPAACEDCGFPTEITEALTMLYCSNPRCIEKVVQRVVAIALKLGIKGLGESMARGFLTKYQLDNPLIIFAYELSDGTFTDSCSVAVSEKIYNQIQSCNKFLLWEYVRVANLPHIQDCAQPIFSGYSSIEAAFADIEQGGVAFIAKKLGVGGVPSGVSVRAAQVYTTLIQFKQDLIEPLESINIIDTASVDLIKVAISTSVGAGFASKESFVAYVNERFAGRVYIEFMSSVSKNIGFLVWSKTGSPTSKVDKVCRLQSQGYDIKILTGVEFVEHLDSLVFGGNVQIS